MIKVRITKLNHLMDIEHPNGIDSGYTVEKEVDKLPLIVVGKPVYLIDDTSRFHTSTVKEIIDNETFKTRNSIYKMEII